MSDIPKIDIGGRIEVRVTRLCSGCAGDGVLNDGSTCERCKGSGPVPRPPPATAKQKAAQVANWHRRQVIGACAIVNIPTLGYADDDADLKVAQAALRKIQARHSYRSHIRGLMVEARKLAREGSVAEIHAALALQSWDFAPEARAILEAAKERKLGKAIDTLLESTKGVVTGRMHADAPNLANGPKSLKGAP